MYNTNNQVFKFPVTFGNCGFGCFKKFAIVGDSLSVGYHWTQDQEIIGKNIDHSWGQYIANMYGCQVYYTGIAGSNSKSWLENTSTDWGLLYTRKIGEMPLYFICYGANEYNIPIGNPTDVSAVSPSTLYGYVGKMYHELKLISPNAYIIAVGCSRQQSNIDAINEVYKYVSSINSRCYYYDIQQELQSIDFTKWYYGNHYTAFGYQKMASLYNNVVYNVIEENRDDFLYINDVDPDDISNLIKLPNGIMIFFGNVVINVTANNVNNQHVIFNHPFITDPKIFVTAYTARPDLIQATAYNITGNSVDIYASNKTNETYNVVVEFMAIGNWR